MRFNVISNTTNGYGLQTDCEILKERLEELGHEVRLCYWTRPDLGEAADVNIFVELVAPGFFRLAKEQWALPNPEWWLPQLWDRHRAAIHRFLCKTPDCFRIFSALAPGRCVFTGFRSRDLFRTVERERSFIHVTGKSQTKNTEAIIEAWRKFKMTQPLTLVSSREDYRKLAANIPNVAVLGPRDAEERANLMNRHLFHLCPSRYEGWGHYLHEALSCGAVIMTTNAPPMNEVEGIDKRLLVEPAGRLPHGVTMLNLVRPDEIKRVVDRMWSLGLVDIELIQRNARAAFLGECRRFRTESEHGLQVGVPVLR